MLSSIVIVVFKKKTAYELLSGLVGSEVFIRDGHCGAKTHKGTPCQKAALKGKTRCRLHGGLSTGPRTAEGKARVAAAHTKHGRRSKDHVARVKAINAELRRITYELKRGGWIP